MATSKNKKPKAPKRRKKNKKNVILTVFIIAVVAIPILVINLGWFPAAVIASASILAPFAIEVFSNSFNFTKRRKTTKNPKTKKGKTTKPKKTRNTRKKRKKKFWKIVMVFFLVIFIIGVLGGLGLMVYIAKSAPEFDPENLYSKESSVVYDADGNEFAKLGLKKRENVTYNEVPQILLDAIIATEDSRFYTHNGFDLPRFTKSALVNIQTGSFAQGGSTLTMQVAKNRFTTSEQTIIRKLNDIYLAIFKLEKEYTKEEIFEFYINFPYLGGSSYGVEQASQTYFGKSVVDINISEAAMIAGMFQAPNAYDPFLTPEKTEKRRKEVLYLMELHGYISEKEHEIAKKLTVDKIVVGVKSDNNNPYQGYLDTVIEEVIIKTGESPYDIPMEIFTNMDREKQQAAEDICNEVTFTFEDEMVQTGFAVTEIETGKVIAIGAGRDRAGERGFNFATMIKRQPGSTAKPLFDYGPAIEFNNWSTYRPILDDAYSYSNDVEINNWDRKFQGLITARVALEQSRNIPALKTFQAVDNKNILGFVQSLGITPESDDGYLHEAHSIGGFNGVSPLEITAAYAAFGNGGFFLEPHTINKIVYKGSGETLLLNPSKERVMKESTAFMITDMLKTTVTNGLASSARVRGVNVAGKTGTTNLDSKTEEAWGLPSYASMDLWVVGYTPNYSVGMWYGYKELSTDFYHGPSSRAQRTNLYQAIIKSMVDYDGKDFKKPGSVVRVTVERETLPAALPSALTPSDMKLTEYFIKGTEPTEVSPRYSQLLNVTNFAGEFISEANSINLSWDPLPTPYYLEDEYLNKYYANLYEDQKDKYLGIRKAGDLATKGIIGYELYQKDASGSLNLIDFTTGTTYKKILTGPTESITFVVKTNYSISKAAQSSGTELTVSITGASFVDISLSGDKIIDLIKDEVFTDPGVTVLNNLVNVTSDASITKVITQDDIEVGSVDTSTTGTYKIEYTTTYNDTTEVLTRTVHITE